MRIVHATRTYVGRETWQVYVKDGQTVAEAVREAYHSPDPPDVDEYYYTNPIVVLELDDDGMTEKAIDPPFETWDYYLEATNPEREDTQ